MPNLVQALGYDYFSDFLREALFIHDGDVHRMRVADNNRVVTWNMSRDTEVILQPDDFQGWSKFSYPMLGYRRFEPGRIGFVTKRQSTNRGLRLSNVQVEYSPLTRLLADYGAIGNHRDERGKSLSIMKPMFDSLDDLPRLLSGELSGLVLSESLIIEPAVLSESMGGNWYTIYFKRVPIGTVSNDGTFGWVDNKYRALLPEGRN